MPRQASARAMQAALATHAKKTAARESNADRAARTDRDNAIVADAARAAGEAGNARMAERLGTRRPARDASPVAPPVAPAMHRVPVGVYRDRNMHGAIVVKHAPTGLWYLTMLTGKITLEHSSEEKFERDFTIAMPQYPIRRALRIYKESLLERDEKCDKVMYILLRDL